MPAPKGNKFALGNKGTNKMFGTPQELQEAIDNYFASCDSQVIAYKGEVGITKPYTVTGLAISLGCDRVTLHNYGSTEGYEDYFNIIKEAKEIIADHQICHALVFNYHAGLASKLLNNNHKFVDKTEVDNKMTVGSTKVIRPE